MPTPTLAACLLIVSLSSTDAEFEELRLDTIAENHVVDDRTIEFAPGGRRVAYATQTASGSVIVVDGEAGPAYSFADSPTFSPDGSRVAYRAGKVVDKRTEKWWIVVDGKRGSGFSFAGSPAFTPDGKKVAFWAAKGVKLGSMREYVGGDYFMMLGKKKGPRFSDPGLIKPPLISSDGKKLCYVAHKANKYVAVFGKKQSDPFSMIGEPAMTAKGNEIAFPAILPDGQWAIVDAKGKVGDKYDRASSPVFGPKGKLAYVARERGASSVLWGKKKLDAGGDHVSGLTISPDGKRIGWKVNIGGQDPFAGMPGMPPGMSGFPGSNVGGIQGGTWKLLVDGEAGPEFDQTGDVVFPAGSGDFAYAAKADGKWRVVMSDGWQSDPFDYVAAIQFSSDDRQIGFGVRNGQELWWKVRPLSK